MIIILRSIKFFGFHGVYESEKILGNNFEADISVVVVDSNVFLTDELNDTLDYSKINDAVLHISGSKQYSTLESLCYQIGKAILDIAKEIESVSIELKKIKPPKMENVDSVGVSLTLSKCNR